MKTEFQKRADAVFTELAEVNENQARNMRKAVGNTTNLDALCNGAKGKR